MRFSLCVGAAASALLLGRFAAAQNFTFDEHMLVTQQLPSTQVVTGDVAIQDPGSTLVSDILRITGDPFGLHFTAQLFSDFNPNDPTEEIPPDPADLTTGLPTLQSNVVRVFEDATGRVVYQPVLPTDPGFFVGFAAQPVYIVQSDGDVPEPAVLSLAPALAGLLLPIRRRR